MEKTNNILAICDNHAERKIAPLLDAWRRNGFVTREVSTIEEVDKLLPIENFDVIVVMSRKYDYISIIQPFTQLKKIPVFVLPCIDMDTDYTISEMTKIFIHTMVCREDNRAEDIKVVDDLLIDYRRRKVFSNNVEIPLSKLEFDLLSELANAPNHVLPYHYLYSSIWGEDYLESPDVLQDAVKRLRKSFREQNEPISIENMRGFGYRLVSIERNIDYMSK